MIIQKNILLYFITLMTILTVHNIIISSLPKAFSETVLDSSLSRTRDHLLDLYKIENELRSANQNLLSNINFTVDHIEKAVQLSSPDLIEEVISITPRVAEQIQSEITSFKSLANSTLPLMVKGMGISEKLSHLEDLIEITEINLIKNNTKANSLIPYLFSGILNDIYTSYNNSKIWSNASIAKNEDNKFQDKISEVEFQTAQGLVEGIPEFIGFIDQFNPQINQSYNITKIKEDFSSLNMLIENKSDIIEISKSYNSIFNSDNFNTKTK